ncbi:copper amine oxidase N-terminal domain-containing protein [Paenibacillus sp. ACRSA]|uniref:stalk domain-containing protein n=1 Tax=Paenibacillus sp. ACRSA TaxID=2918211 RepID=UPI001EF6BB1A|nr:stalk domain-containing protein [Paenibacillus sp. ACRSA]MCG7377390.1 copper amine oxidase N-terminal domain-containing protein [Paenibacillus sp. ACRSA]
MKKILSKIPTFTLGLIVGVAVTAGTAVGAATYLKATQSNVKIVVDGNQAKLSDSPMNIGGRLYLPVRDTANVMGYSVESVTSSQVSLKEGLTASNTANGGSTSGQSGTVVTTPSSSNSGSANTTASRKIANLRETYSTNGKLDAEKIRIALNNGALDVNSTDSTNGNNTLLMYVIEEDNFEAYKAINRNALDVNIQRDDGKTALMMTVIENSSFYFGEVINKKPDTKLKDNSSKTALDYAENNSSLRVDLNAYMLFNK